MHSLKKISINYKEMPLIQVFFFLNVLISLSSIPIKRNFIISMINITKNEKKKKLFLFVSVFFASNTIKYFLLEWDQSQKTLVIKSKFLSEKIYMFQRNGAIR